MTQEEKLKELSYIGYVRGHEFNPKEFNLDRIAAIREIVRGRLEKRKTINHNIGTSYGLKHCVENQIEAYGEPLCGYVSNGELIYAMILEGFDVCICDKNARFNVTTKSLMRIPRNPLYDSEGNVYDYWERWRKRPVYRIDMVKYGHLLKEKAWQAMQLT